MSQRQHRNKNNTQNKPDMETGLLSTEENEEFQKMVPDEDEVKTCT